MRKRGYLLGRDMIWEKAIQHYADAFGKAREERMDVVSTQLPYLSNGGSSNFKLPGINLDHLYRLTDSTGIVQHARYHLPFYEEGYCTDDNARALILSMMLADAGVQDLKLAQATDTYSAFLNHAYTDGHRQFRNFMSYDRHWLEDVGSDDSTGRTVWALGTCIGRSNDRNATTWAMNMMERVLPTIADMGSPRAWAFALVGLNEYQKRFSNDRLAKTIQQQLTDKLMFRFSETAMPDWPWFENVLSYDNAVLAHALLVSGDAVAQETGLTALRWLMKLQTSERTHFQPIGSNGFYVKGEPRAFFDQQPLEAQSSIAACLAAYRLTGEADWYRKAIRVFRWFSGLNDLGLPLYDEQTGGCRDGLHIDRVNMNQGAESTLSYLMALAELHQVQQQMAVPKALDTLLAG